MLCAGPYLIVRDQVNEGALDVHFEVAVALSGIIAPMLYIRLRKAQCDQHENAAICLTEMSFTEGRSDSYSPVKGDDCDGDFDPQRSRERRFVLE